MLVFAIIIVLLIVIVWLRHKPENMVGVAPGYNILPCQATHKLPDVAPPVRNPFLWPFLASDCVDDMYLARGERPPERDILRHASTPDHVELIGQQ